jgi:hypothetical protein
MRTHLINLFKCESRTDEYKLSVLVRRHSHSYVDERNSQFVPSGRVAAERVFWYEF